MKEYFRLFGFKVTDVITGFTGVVECISFDLYGCVQATVKPAMNEKGEMTDAKWFDIKRLQAVSEAPVMEVPSFGRPGSEIGAAEKPSR